MTSTSTGIPPLVASFLRDHVGSIELLEVLLCLHHGGARAWTADAIAAELRIQPRSCEARCAALAKVGLVKNQNDVLTFDRASPLAPVIDQLADAYRTHRVAIISLIFSKPVDSSRQFADAFVLKKRGEHDG